MITLMVNGKKVKAQEGAILLEVLRKLSISIPTLCYHPDLTPQGSCRLCTVEVRENGRSQLVTSCNYPVRAGIDVRTHSRRVLRARRVLIELLLARCPQAGIVRQLARELRVKKSRFRTFDPENTCILCGLCVRTCHEVVGASAIGFSSRGIDRKVGTPFHIDTDKCVACGACEYVCPTGAISMEMERIRTMRQSDTGTLRYCRYMRLGLVDFMICSNGFECWRCELDQTMEDRFETHPAFATKPARKRLPVRWNGFTFLPDLLYSDQHVWVKPMDQRVRCGLDELVSLFAAVADGASLPSAGTVIKREEPLVRLVMGQKRVEVAAPINGRIVLVNHEVVADPALIWKAPYDRGWLAMMEPDSPEELSELASGLSTKTGFAEQAASVTNLFRQEAGEITEKETELGVLMSHDAHVLRGFLRNQWHQVRDILLIRPKG
jgi:ferredoxin/glycine cleavage system H lipoate-binding protein